jgi:tetratricopeptide (TPR) repeat protein
MRNARFLVAVAAVLILGCADTLQQQQQDKQKQQEGIGKLSQTDVDELSAQRSTFDDVRDPPFTADTRFAAGQLADSRGAWLEAIGQYKQALALEPKHLKSLYGLGVDYAQMHLYPQAIATWQTYIDATGGDATSYSNLAYCNELAGKFADAEVAYKKGILKDPQNESCRINYGLMLARRGRTNEAAIQLGAVLKPAEVHYNLGSAHELQGRKDQAKAEYTKAIQLDPNLVEAKARLAALR